MGVVEVYVDQTASRDLFRQSAMTLGLSLAGLIMLAFLVPAIGFAVKSGQAKRSAQALADREAQGRRAAEAQAAELAAVNARVQSLNDEMAANLRKLNDAQVELLRQGKLAQLGQLTATVAHELRNPLGAVRTSAFLLERKVKDKGLGIEPQIERINNGITRCDTIISQLIDFARNRSIQPEEVSLDEWFAKVVEAEAQRIPPEIEVECHLGAGDATVSLDPGRMGRVVGNLLANAAEAIAGMGRQRGPSAGPPRIVVSTALTARGIEIAVADNGPGIAADVRPKIFEPLFTTKSFGAGLGLPAVQKIMEQHGGGIDLKSEPGQGAVFTAWWPYPQRLKEAV